MNRRFLLNLWFWIIFMNPAFFFFCFMTILKGLASRLFVIFCLIWNRDCIDFMCSHVSEMVSFILIYRFFLFLFPKLFWLIPVLLCFVKCFLIFLFQLGLNFLKFFTPSFIILMIVFSFFFHIFSPFVFNGCHLLFKPQLLLLDMSLLLCFYYLNIFLYFFQVIEFRVGFWHFL